MSEGDATDVDTNPEEQGKLVSALVGLAGLWLLVQALVFELTVAGFWNDVIVGVALVAIGAYNVYRRADERLASSPAAALAALLGLWLVASPFVFAGELVLADVATGIGFWNDVAIGVVVFLLGLYSLLESRSVEVVAPT